MKITELMEAVGGDNLYHYTSVAGAINILRDKQIKAGEGTQIATTAQTKLPTVSVTRDWNYAIGQGTDVGKTHDVIFILNRRKIENNYKTISTSQSTDTRSGAFNTLKPAKRDALRSASAGGEKFQQIDTNNDRRISSAERAAFKQKHTDADGNLSAEAREIWAKVVAANMYDAPGGQGHDVRTDIKWSGEFEEVIPVPKGYLPLSTELVTGIFLNSQEAKDIPALANYPLRVGGR
jgi:hypothetical protein